VVQYEHLTPVQRCPVCGHLLDRTAGGAERPKEGDVTVCVSCAEPLQFGAGLLLVRAEPKGLDEITRAEIAYLQWLLTQTRADL